MLMPGGIIGTPGYSQPAPGVGSGYNFTGTLPPLNIVPTGTAGQIGSTFEAATTQNITLGGTLPANFQGKATLNAQQIAEIDIAMLAQGFMTQEDFNAKYLPPGFRVPDVSAPPPPRPPQPLSVGGYGGAFGVGSGSGPLGGGSLVERNLNRWTIVFAVLFVVNTIVLLKI